MSGIRKFFSLRRAPKVVVNPKDDLRQLDYICHDTKVFQNISDYQRQQIYPIRNVLIAKAKEVTSLSAKIKAIDDCVKENIELLVAKAISDKLEEFEESSTITNAPIKKSGFFSFLSSSKSNDSQSQSLQQLSLLESAAPKGRPLLGSSQMQLILRLQLCKEYLTSLQSLLEKSEISNDALNGSSKLLGVVDAVLLGSASERVAMHLSLFDSKVYQHTLQTSFYSLYESEIQALVRHLDKYPMQVKAHGKLLRKNTPSSYLLDTLELNTKARCILAWMDPNFFGGFRPLDDNHNLPLSDVIKGRRQFFQEGEKIASLYVEHLKNKFTEYQNTKDDDRGTLRQGAYFIFATILLDWLVCTI